MELDGNSHELRSKPGAPHRFAPENSEILKFRQSLNGNVAVTTNHEKKTLDWMTQVKQWSHGTPTKPAL